MVNDSVTPLSPHVGDSDHDSARFELTLFKNERGEYEFIPDDDDAGSYEVLNCTEGPPEHVVTELTYGDVGVELIDLCESEDEMVLEMKGDDKVVETKGSEKVMETIVSEKRKEKATDYGKVVSANIDGKTAELNDDEYTTKVNGDKWLISVSKRTVKAVVKSDGRVERTLKKRRTKSKQLPMHSGTHEKPQAVESQLQINQQAISSGHSFSLGWTPRTQQVNCLGQKYQSHLHPPQRQQQQQPSHHTNTEEPTPSKSFSVPNAQFQSVIVGAAAHSPIPSQNRHGGIFHLPSSSVQNNLRKFHKDPRKRWLESHGETLETSELASNTTVVCAPWLGSQITNIPHSHRINQVQIPIIPMATHNSNSHASTTNFLQSTASSIQLTTLANFMRAKSSGFQQPMLHVNNGSVSHFPHANIMHVPAVNMIRVPGASGAPVETVQRVTNAEVMQSTSTDLQMAKSVPPTRATVSGFQPELTTNLTQHVFIGNPHLTTSGTSTSMSPDFQAITSTPVAKGNKTGIPQSINRGIRATTSAGIQQITNFMLQRASMANQPIRTRSDNQGMCDVTVVPLSKRLRFTAATYNDTDQLVLTKVNLAQMQNDNTESIETAGWLQLIISKPIWHKRLLERWEETTSRTKLSYKYTLDPKSEAILWASDTPKPSDAGEKL